MRGVHLLAHGGDVLLQRREVAAALQNALPDRLERGADLLVARAVARARERLVLPHPRHLALVLLESGGRRHEQAALARRAQPQVGLE